MLCTFGKFTHHLTHQIIISNEHTLLHTADWQIGKQFAHIPGDPGAALRLQRLATVEAIAELARERQVDAVLVAGDVFEDNAVSDETLRRTACAGPIRALGVAARQSRRGLDPERLESPEKTSRSAPNVILAIGPSPSCSVRGGWCCRPLQRRHEVRDLTEWFDTFASDAACYGSGSRTVGSRTACLRRPRPENPSPIPDRRQETSIIWHWVIGMGP